MKPDNTQETIYVGLEQVYSVIDSRYRSRRPLIVTTNLTLQQIQNPTDTAYARIYGPAAGNVRPCPFYGRQLPQGNRTSQAGTAEKSDE